MSPDQTPGMKPHELALPDQLALRIGLFVLVAVVSVANVFTFGWYTHFEILFFLHIPT
jgi:hypothetical protein